MANKNYICCNREVDRIPINENVEITAHMLFSHGSDRREIIRMKPCMREKDKKIPFIIPRAL